MICPRCKEESFGAKWCPKCGIQLENENMQYMQSPTTGKSNNTTNLVLAVFIPVVIAVLLFGTLIAVKIINYSKSEEANFSDKHSNSGINHSQIGDYEEETAAPQNDTPKYDTPQYELSVETAENVLRRYCKAYVNAVNTGDFSVVAPYIKGNFYNSQYNMVSSLHSQGVGERFDFLNVHSVQKAGDTKWKVRVSEGETIFYPSGKETSKTYSWLYTIEYIDGEYYPTNIE